MSEEQINPGVARFVDRLIERGYAEDEIVDEVFRGKSPTLHDRRFLERYVHGRVADAKEVTREQVLEKEAELKARGAAHGVGSIAKALKTSETTVRRRLGRLKS